MLFLWRDPVSIPIVKGVRYRVGSYKPQRVTREELTQIDVGEFYLTNKRVVFDGAHRNTAIRYSSLLGRDAICRRHQAGKVQRSQPLLTVHWRRQDGDGHRFGSDGAGLSDRHTEGAKCIAVAFPNVRQSVGTRGWGSARLGEASSRFARDTFEASGRAIDPAGANSRAAVTRHRELAQK